MERAGLARYATIYFVAATSSRKAAGKYFTMQAGSVHALVRMGMVAGGVASHPTQVCMQVAQWLMVTYNNSVG